MLYLLIPLGIFLVLAGLTWLLMAPRPHERVWTQKLESLGPIISVALTARKGDPTVVMKLPKRAALLKLKFAGADIDVWMPLVTHQQRDQKDGLLAGLRGLGMAPRLTTVSEGQEALEWQVRGAPAEAVAAIKEAFMLLFGVTPRRQIEYRVSADMRDLGVIEQALDETLEEDVPLPAAMTSQSDVADRSDPRSGCIASLANVLLLPMVFMTAYLQAGYVAASAALIAVILLWQAYKRWKGSKSGIGASDLMSAVNASFAAATIYTRDPFYLQLIPTLVFSIGAAAQILSEIFNRPRLSFFGNSAPYKSRTERLLFTFAVVVTCLGGIAMNEHLRTSASLDTWAWFFAFVRIELLLGFLVTAIPLLVYQVNDQFKKDEEAAVSDANSNSPESSSS